MKPRPKLFDKALHRLLEGSACNQNQQWLYTAAEMSPDQQTKQAWAN